MNEVASTTPPSESTIVTPEAAATRAPGVPNVPNLSEGIKVNKGPQSFRVPSVPSTSTDNKNTVTSVNATNDKNIAVKVDATVDIAVNGSSSESSPEGSEESGSDSDGAYEELEDDEPKKEIEKTEDKSEYETDEGNQEPVESAGNNGQEHGASNSINKVSKGDKTQNDELPSQSQNQQSHNKPHRPGQKPIQGDEPVQNSQNGHTRPKPVRNGQNEHKRPTAQAGPPNGLSGSQYSGC